MRRQLMCGLVMFASCSRPEPRTTGFAIDDHARSKLGTICVVWDPVGEAMSNGNPMESKRFHREWCVLSLDHEQAKVWGDAMIEFQGSYQTGVFCGLHIGPVEVTKPVPPTILENFIDDPVLARQIDAKLAPIDITKEYSYQERVAGFQLDVVQQGVRLRGSDRTLVVDLHMNGCDQYPDSSPAATKTGRPLTP